MNLFIKRKLTHRLREQLMVTKAEGCGGGRDCGFELTCTHCCTCNGQSTRTYCAARAELYSILCDSLNGKII